MSAKQSFSLWQNAKNAEMKKRHYQEQLAYHQREAQRTEQALAEKQKAQEEVLAKIAKKLDKKARQKAA